jgi:tRNA modification GTPase
MPESPETIAAIATAPGQSGIGIIRVSGKKSLSIAETITSTAIKPRLAKYCQFSDQQNEIIDKGVVLYFNSPGSYTGEDVVEFHGHGSMITLNLLLKEILKLGARAALPGEFTQRAYLNGKLDLLQAEAVADLIESNSEKAARHAIQSLTGDFSERVNKLVDSVTILRVYVEGSLDFPEDEIDFLVDADIPQRISDLLQQLDNLLSSAVAGKKLRQGVKTVIIGRPNVGKSSLLNALMGSEKAIVTDLAGTTRDIIEDTIYLSGMAITLIDTAGIRNPENAIEAEGIKRSWEQIKEAEVLIVVTDQAEFGQDDLKLISELPDTKVLFVHNKVDLFDHPAERRKLDGREHLFLSAKDKVGIDNLMYNLREVITEKNHAEDLVLARERHIQLLNKSRDALTAGLEEFNKNTQGEILAEHLKDAQEILGEITGKVHNDDLLGEIFSRFCIGK